MPERSSNQKRREDPNEAAARILRSATGEDVERRSEQQDRPKNPAAVELGRRGGKKGGKARAEKLTPEQRREIARKAAKKRWSND